MTPTPLWRSSCTTANSDSTSFWVSEEVGSSMMTMRAADSNKAGDFRRVFAQASRSERIFGLRQNLCADALKELCGAGFGARANRIDERRVAGSRRNAIFSATLRSGNKRRLLINASDAKLVRRGGGKIA